MTATYARSELPPSQQCTAKSKRSGVRCKRLVIGSPLCRIHGGRTPAVLARREETIALWQRGQVVGTEQDEAPISGHQALLDELRRTNQQVRQLGHLLASTTDPDRDFPGQLARWISERGHLLRVGHAVVQLRVDEGTRRLADEEVAILSSLMSAVVTRLLVGLGLDPEDEGIAAVAREALQLLSDGPVELDGPS